MTGRLPTNWGRWGEDDEAGTLNLITDEVRARAAAEVRTGRSVSLALPVEPASMLGGPFSPPAPASPPLQQALLHTGLDPIAMAEIWVLGPHHVRLTHLDAPAHMPVDGRVYPGRAFPEAVSPAGIQHASTTVMAAGFVTRGVLLDLAPGDRLPEGHPVTGADLTGAEQRTGTYLQPGDALVLRGGWSAARDLGKRMPGVTVDALSWMHDHDVSVYAGDIGDAHPSIDRQVELPLHQVGLARLGMPLIDVTQVEDLVRACGELGRSSFMLSVAPPRVHAATGVPVNPLAIF